jgi:hypothetical protein
MNTQKIEIYIGYTDYTWGTAIIDMPENTPHVGDFIEQEAIKIGRNSPLVHGEVAFAALYNEWPIGEEDEYI